MNARQNRFNRPGGGDALFSREAGMRAAHAEVTNDDGSVSRVISIGVPRDHPFADPESEAGTSGLHNLRIGPIRLPVAPTFVVRVRGANRASSWAR